MAFFFWSYYYFCWVFLQLFFFGPIIILFDFSNTFFGFNIIFSFF